MKRTFILTLLMMLCSLAFGQSTNVAKIGEQEYATLSAAIGAASAGSTITFIADITENVTISKSLTIDGAGKTYTGAMTLKADATINNVNFDGKGYNGYAIETRGAQHLTIEYCTAVNYGYGFVQLPSATRLTTVKNVVVSNMNYGVKVDHSSAVVLENVDITANVAAVLNSNYGEKTITIKNSKLNIYGTWTRNNTIKTNIVFEGENAVGQFKHDAAIDNFKLADKNSTLTAPQGLTVTTDVDGSEVVYAGGKYQVVKEGTVAKIGDTCYTSFASAYNVAQSGDEITLFEDVMLTGKYTITKDITIDGNGFSIKADETAVWYTLSGKLQIKTYNIHLIGVNSDNVTLKNIVLDCNNNAAGINIYCAQNVIFDNVSIINATKGYAALTVNGSTLTTKTSFTALGNSVAIDISNGSGVTSDLGLIVEEGTVFNLDNKTVKFASVAANDVTNAVDAEGNPYFAAMDNAYYYTVAQIKSRTTAFSNGLTLLSNVEIDDKSIKLKGTLNLNSKTITLNGGNIEITGNTTIVNLGGINCDIKLKKGYTLTAPEGLNVISGVEGEEGYVVVYENGVYSLLALQVVEIKKGWNWFSYYRENNDVLGQLKSQLLNKNGNVIKSQTDGFTYIVENNGVKEWEGSLASTTPTKMYMINNKDAATVEIEGNVVDYANINTAAITIKKGWNWIGYPVSEAVNIDAALEKVQAQSGDKIKSRDDGHAEYQVESGKWIGSLANLSPGQGYIYYKASGAQFTFTYNVPATREEVKANITADNNYWVPNSAEFANNMTMTAVLNIDGNMMKEGFEVAAFANGEVRGSARPIFVEAVGQYMLFMTIYGEGNEELTFKCYDIYSDEEYTLGDRMVYADDAMVGSIGNPYVLTLNTMGIGENAANAISIYPNPTTTNTAISFETVCDMVEVFNSLGAKVAEYSNVDRIDGVETAGVYVIRVTNGSTVQNCRLIVK